MCGITGFYSLEHKFSSSQLTEMNQLLSHRGPDAEGYYVDGKIGLAHKRLSILDLSDNGKQPMTSHNGRYIMVYNGEVYNYREIAAEIQKLSINTIVFKSSSDSEVILEAFVHWGTDFVHKLNGMFSIAIYDKQDDILWLFRDRLGVKPLYYYDTGGDFLFASELKSIRAIVGKKLSISEEAINQFLHLGFISSPLTIYNNVYKLSPGCYLKISSKGVDKKRYWSVYNAIADKTIDSEKEAIVKISDMLASSIQYQLNSDVPFGIFLSGGIDSSLVAAQAASMSTTAVNTFSIGFRENQYNESDYARNVASFLKTSHHEFIVSHNDAMELVDKITDVYDEPFADSSAIPTMLVSKLAKKYVTVTLSGEGGDELFFGYGSYKWAKRLNNPLIYSSRSLLHSILKNINNNKYKRAAKLFEFVEKDELPSHIFSQEQYMFAHSELKKILYNSNSLQKFQWSFPQTELMRNIDPMERQALFDIIHYLPGDLLTKVDRASMLYSVETRVPYLDHRLVEVALNISPNLKHKNGISKYILKEILYQYIPKHYFDRPKQGFAIPLVKWLKYELRYLIEDVLKPEIISKFNIVKAEEVEEIKKRFLAGEDYLFNRVWLLIILHKWLLKYA